MQIWFNVSAIVVIVLFNIIYYLLSFVSANFGNPDHPYFWLLLVLTAGLLENVKVRGRILKIPIWIIGSIFFITTSKDFYHETGSLSGFYLLLSSLIVIIVATLFMDKRRWNKAKESMTQLTALQANSEVDLTLLLTHMKTSFYVPNYLLPENYIFNLAFGQLYDIKYKKWFAKPEINQHYMHFFDALEGIVTEEEFKKYAAVMKTAIKNTQTDKVFSIDQSLVENILKLIESKEKEVKLLNRSSKA